MGLKDTFFFHQPLRDIYYMIVYIEDTNRFNRYIQNINDFVRFQWHT